MLERLFTSSVADSLTLRGTIIIVFAALLLGLGISLVYRYIHREEDYSASFTVTLIMLPAIIAMIIFLVGNNVARAFSLAGAFSLIRFRSAPGDAKDIAYVFFTLGVGLACGMGYIGYAVLFAIIICIVMYILYKVEFDVDKRRSMRLKIILPEDMEYEGAFDEVMKKYTYNYKLVGVKTKEFGSLFELLYEVVLKPETQSKVFIDELRCKNGNLNIMLGMKESKENLKF